MTKRNNSLRGRFSDGHATPVKRMYRDIRGGKLLSALRVPPVVEYLIIGGAGGGGTNKGTTNQGAGGGSAGQVLTGTMAILRGQSITFSVGAGGRGGKTLTWTNTYGEDGSDTVFGSITARNGAGGGAAKDTIANSTGRTGHHGGGTGSPASNSAIGRVNGLSNRSGGGVPANGWANGAGGGGGAGAGGSGSDGIYMGGGGVGGPGISSSITGQARMYAGGGAGSAASAQAAAAGGSGVGGTGGTDATGGTAGAPNTGSGGGGSRQSNQPGGAGGSGVIVIAYPDTYAPLIITGTVFEMFDTRPGYRVYRILSGQGIIQFSPNYNFE